MTCLLYVLILTSWSFSWESHLQWGLLYWLLLLACHGTLLYADHLPGVSPEQSAGSQAQQQSQRDGSANYPTYTGTADLQQTSYQHLLSLPLLHHNCPQHRHHHHNHHHDTILTTTTIIIAIMSSTDLCTLLYYNMLFSVLCWWQWSYDCMFVPSVEDPS